MRLTVGLYPVPNSRHAPGNPVSASPLSGAPALALAYGVALAGALAALALRRARLRPWLFAPLLALPMAVLGLALASAAGPWVAGAASAARLALTLAMLAALGLTAGLWAARRDGRDGTVLRGAVIRGGARRTPVAGLSIAGVPVTAADEVRHFKCVGTTGTGKSTAIRELLSGALRRGDRAVIADPDGAALARHYDPARGDVILNPFDARARRWDPFLELRVPHDPEQLARSLVGEGRGGEQAWRAYGQMLLAELLRRLALVPGDRLGELVRLLAVAEPGELRVLLEGSAASALVAEGNERMLASVRAVAASATATLAHLAAQRAAPFSVRDWVLRGSGVLFLPYRADEIAALRSIVSTWLRTAIFQLLSQGEADHRLWFVVDELDALGAIDGLSDALARMRKFGGRALLGFQSIAQVSGAYGDAAARTIVENCASTLILRCSASEGGGTARFAAELVGQREVVRLQASESHGEAGLLGRRRSSAVSVQRVLEPALLASEIERLPDLEGFLKLASGADWRRVRVPVPGAMAP
jgi:type IV secretory pathway TraG/TraD family ATPase VirD4